MCKDLRQYFQLTSFVYSLSCVRFWYWVYNTCFLHICIFLTLTPQGLFLTQTFLASCLPPWDHDTDHLAQLLKMDLPFCIEESWHRKESAACFCFVNGADCCKVILQLQQDVVLAEAQEKFQILIRSYFKRLRRKRHIQQMRGEQSSVWIFSSMFAWLTRSGNTYFSYSFFFLSPRTSFTQYLNSLIVKQD